MTLVSALLASVLLVEPGANRFGQTSVGETHGGSWTSETEFAISGALSEAVRIDFALDFDELSGDSPEGPCPGAGALVPAQFEDGTYGCWCWGDGRWLALPCPAVEKMRHLDGRIELRDLGDDTFVSYAVKTGEVSVTLELMGRRWFRGAATNGVHWVRKEGEGELASFTGFDAPISSDDYTLATYPGTAETTIGGETALTTDLAVLAETGTDPVVIGGLVRPCIALDTDRPCVGKALTAKTSSFLGLDLAATCVWEAFDPDGANGHLVATGDRMTPTSEFYEHWLRFQAEDAYGVVAEKKFYFSRLPVAYMTTDDGGDPTAEKEVHTGNLRVQGNDAWAMQYDGAYEIKVRGNSSAGKAKKPYKVKLDKKTKMFGFPKNKHWVMLANYTDDIQMRNKLAYDFANDIGSLGMKSTWVVGILNGRYDGLYQFCEHIRADPDRVPIRNWEDDVADETDLSTINPSSADITGGYLVEFSMEMDSVSQFTTAAGKLRMQTMVGSPEYLKTNPAMYNWLRGYLQNYWDACVSPDRKSKEGFHYRQYADVKSMADYLLVYEIFANYDGARKSRYAYKAHGEKLKFGPVWDFDHCSGDPEGWQTMWSEHSMFMEWASDQYFCKVLRGRYWAVRPQILALIAEGGPVDTHAALIVEVIAADVRRWGGTPNFVEDIANYKRFISSRVAWFDRQFATVESTISSLHNEAQTIPGVYNPEYVYPGEFTISIK